MSDESTELTEPWERERWQHRITFQSELPFESLDEADRAVHQLVWALVEVARLKEELEKCAIDRAQDQHRLFHLEGHFEDQRREGEEAVLNFVKNGRFLSDSAPGAQFAREVEAGWRSWGKATADQLARADVDRAVAEAVAKDQA